MPLTLFQGERGLAVYIEDKNNNTQTLNSGSNLGPTPVLQNLGFVISSQYGIVCRTVQRQVVEAAVIC